MVRVVIENSILKFPCDEPPGYFGRDRVKGRA